MATLFGVHASLQSACFGRVLSVLCMQFQPTHPPLHEWALGAARYSNGSLLLFQQLAQTPVQLMTSRRVCCIDITTLAAQLTSIARSNFAGAA